MDLRRILFPTDFSEASTEAFERAVALAMRSGAKLRVFHAELFHDSDPGRFQAGRRAMLDRAEAIRHRVGAADGAGAEIEFNAARAVSAYAGIMSDLEGFKPDLVVMATHGGGLLMGSVAERLVRDAPCNVLTSRLHAQGDWPLIPGPILVPVDFSENSKRAFDVARRLRNGSPITLVHVVDAPSPPRRYEDAVRSPFEADPGLQQRVEDHLREWAGGPVDGVTAVEGDVRSMLLETCRRHAAVLVVVGTHGIHSSGWAIGSTAERLTRGCAAPVLTVR